MTLSFLVFTFGSLLVAVQVAGGQYTPRVIATIFLSNNVVRACVGLFVVTLFFALRTTVEMDRTVDQLNTAVSVLLGLLSVVTFLFLIDYAARMLRPVSIVANVGDLGLGVIRSVYPEQTGRPHREASATQRAAPRRGPWPTRVPRAWCWQCRVDQLVELARDADGLIEVVPQVGDFLAADEPLFHLYGDAATSTIRTCGPRWPRESSARWSRIRPLLSVSWSISRSRPCPPAINDPTTAVLAIDQLHRLLRRVGLQDLRGERVQGRAGAGPADFPHAQLGGLRASLLHRDPPLRGGQHPDSAPNACHAGEPDADAAAEPACRVAPATGAARRAVAGFYTFPEDLALARVGDTQGLGGALGVQPVSEVCSG